jgi:hypothetical protein
MTAQVTKLQAAENELKRLMADVSRAMEKAQEAIAKVGGNAAGAPAVTEATTSSR